jgi:hypothetical protein
MINRLLIPLSAALVAITVERLHPLRKLEAPSAASAHHPVAMPSEPVLAPK